MANIRIAGVTYNNVPQIDVPKSEGGGNASFFASDTMQEKNVTPVENTQNVLPDAGYNGLARVTVGADNLSKMVTDSAASDAPATIDLSIAGSFSFPLATFFRSSESTAAAATPGRTTFSGAASRYCNISLPGDVESIPAFAFACMIGLKGINVKTGSTLIDVGARAFYCCANLETVGNLWERLKRASGNSFSTQNGSATPVFESGKNINAPEFLGTFSDSDSYVFNRSGFATFTAPKCIRLGERAFSNCVNLTSADFTALNGIDEYTFNGCSSLTDLYLRGADVVPLSSVNAFSGTPAVGSNPGLFTLHVRSELVDSYKAATNWSTLYNNGSGINIVSL